MSKPVATENDVTATRKWLLFSAGWKSANASPVYRSHAAC